MLQKRLDRADDALMYVLRPQLTLFCEDVPKEAHIDEEDDCRGVAIDGCAKDGAHWAAKPDALWGIHRVLQQHPCVQDSSITVGVVHPAKQQPAR